MSDPGQPAKKLQPERQPVPMWLLAFCYLMMGPGVGINFVLIANAVPFMAQFGLMGLVAAFGVGMVVGIPAAVLLARKIHEGISE